MTNTSIFDRLGARPVLNASGIYTDLGGSRLSPAVWAAVEEANRSFADLPELLDASGAVIARLLGAEAARVTPGASAAIALATAACMTGGDPAKMASLPDPTNMGMPHEVLLQRGHRYKYARCAMLAGARLVEVGSERGTTRGDLEQAISDRTAAILLPAHLDGHHGTVPLADVAAIGRERGAPVVVDAAYQNDPPALMGSFTAAGADLVCFSAKYFGGPNAGGFVAGRRDLVAAVAGLDFTRHESGPYLRFGRAFKLDRTAVVATVVALEEWFATDHAARWADYGRRVDLLRQSLAGMPGLDVAPMGFTMDERFVAEPVNCLVVRFAAETGLSAAAVDRALAAGSPSIRTIVDGDALAIVVETLRDDEAERIAARLRLIVSDRAIAGPTASEAAWTGQPAA